MYQQLLPDGAVPLPWVTQTIVYETEPLSFLDIVSLKSVPRIEEEIGDHPSIVNEKGSNGLYPMHRAALRRNPVIVKLLLEYNANPNAQNEYKETPLHFACKKGSVVVIEALIAGGADVTAVDSGGRGALHCAALGGSVLAAHYLIEVHHFSPHVRDKSLSTPLHIICAQGHAEAFEYFCRHNRSDVFIKDAKGNTALHIAAVRGHNVLCWRLLEIGGYRLLNERNSEECTALDLLKRQPEYKYRDIIRMLSYHSAKKRDVGVIKGPLGAWYGLLLLPVIFYPASITLASCFSNKGPVTLISVLMCIAFFLRHSHRILHVSRWPSPAHAGMFFSGIFYSILCFVFRILPYIYIEARWLTLLYSVNATVLIYVYARLLTRDPGIVKYPRQKKDTLCSYYTIKDVATETVKPMEFCKKCELIPPSKSKHCNLCGHCYHRVDHHCLYLYRCITRDNHLLFVAFNIVVMIKIILFEFAVSLYINDVYQLVENPWDFAMLVFSTEPFIWSLAVVNGLAFLCPLFAIMSQLFALADGNLKIYDNDAMYPKRISNNFQAMFNKCPFDRDTTFHV